MRQVIEIILRALRAAALPGLVVGAVAVASPIAARSAELTVAAAADLQPALEEIAALFRVSHSGDKISVVYGSSGKLFTQIREGAPFDVFFSADIGYAKSLRAEGEAATDPELYAIGRIAIWSFDRDMSKASLEALTDPAIRRVAIANPAHAPYGKRAEEALRAAGLWDKVRDKLVFGENVAQAMQFVRSGAADAGIVSLSLLAGRPAVGRYGYSLIPDALHARLEQAFVITGRGAESPLARDFTRFMKTEAARQVMIRYGFVLPGEKAN